MTKQQRLYTYSPASNLYWLGHQIDGHYVFPLDNLLMMIYSALSKNSSTARMLQLTDVEFKKILIAQKDQKISLRLEIEPTNQSCLIHHIHIDGTKELVLQGYYQFKHQVEISRRWSDDYSLVKGNCSLPFRSSSLRAD